MPSNSNSRRLGKGAAALGVSLGLSILLSSTALANPHGSAPNSSPYLVAQADGEPPSAGGGSDQGDGGEPRRIRRRQFQEGQGGPMQGGDADNIRRRMRQKLRQRFGDGGDPGMPPNAPGDGQTGEGGPRMPGDGDLPRFRENRFGVGQGQGGGFRRRGGQGADAQAGPDGGPGQGLGQGGFRRRGGMGGGGMRGERKMFRGGGQLFGRSPLDLSSLNLTEAQKTKIKEVRQQSSPRSRELMKSIQSNRMGLRDMMFDPNMTDAQIKAKRAELRKLQDQSEDLMLNDFLTIRSVLTKEQRAKLPSIKPGAAGGSPGPRGPGGPPGGADGDQMELSDGPPQGRRLQGFRGNNQE